MTRKQRSTKAHAIKQRNRRNTLSTASLARRNRPPTVKARANKRHNQKTTPTPAHLGKVAFALGGLAGNNAHGAGFLAAALETKLTPVMISCTSGQIFWVYNYLRCLAPRHARKTERSDLRHLLQTEIDKAQPFPFFQDWNLAKLVLFGHERVFQPQFPGLAADFWHNVAAAGQRIIRDFQTNKKPFLSRELPELPPQHWLNPAFPTDFYQTIATELQRSHIGIAFNSYNPAEGCEYVYLNEAARRLLKKAHADDDERYDPGQMSSLSEPRKPRRIYEDISGDAVRRGLWLYWYALNEPGDPHLDGAYFREIMLSELTGADTIFVVRPLHFHWSGEMPSSWASLEDLKTKMAFNGAYIGEKNQILLVNKLLEDVPMLQNKYHPISLIEIEMERPRGFFGYAFEDITVFDEARDKSLREFAKPRRPHPLRPAAAPTEMLLMAQEVRVTQPAMS